MKSNTWLYLGIKRDALSNGVNNVFKNLEDNINNLSLEQYLMQRGYVPMQDELSLSDETYNRYKVRKIERQFLPFVENFKQDFLFSATDLGWIKNPTEEQLNTIVPEYSLDKNGNKFYFKDTFGRNFKDYFSRSIKIDGDVYYAMYCYNTFGGDGYTSRPLPTDQEDFCTMYYYFGLDNVMLNYEIEEKMLK